MILDLRRQVMTQLQITGLEVSRVNGNTGRVKDGFPTVNLSSPCYIMIFLVRKESRIEKLSLDFDVIDHLPPEQWEGAVRSEDLAWFRPNFPERGAIIAKNWMPR